MSEVLELRDGDACPECSVGVLLSTDTIDAVGSNPNELPVGSPGMRCAWREPGDAACSTEWIEVGPGRYERRYPVDTDAD